jgi:hypothetical protein
MVVARTAAMVVVSEQDTHVFVIRMWREPREIEGKESEWRGVIEHVATRERCHVRALHEITIFLAAYIVENS